MWKALQTEPFVDVVALKILSGTLVADPRRVAQLRREGERYARLASPSILPVYDFGIADGFVFLSMPFIDGYTLADVIRQRKLWLRGRPLAACHPLAIAPESDYNDGVVRMVAKIARAVAEAHANQIAHRDVKPGNVLLSHNSAWEVYLGDFGLGRDLDVATIEQLRNGAGTPAYMAPERLLKTTTNEVLCDVFSLGATLFEALTLDRPFVVPEELPRVMWGSYLATLQTPRVRELRPDLPKDLDEIVAKAMDRDPSKRHASAREFIRDLERSLSG